jgi:hypothetical protein
VRYARPARRVKPIVSADAMGPVTGRIPPEGGTPTRPAPPACIALRSNAGRAWPATAKRTAARCAAAGLGCSVATRVEEAAIFSLVARASCPSPLARAGSPCAVGVPSPARNRPAPAGKEARHSSGNVLSCHSTDQGSALNNTLFTDGKAMDRGEDYREPPGGATTMQPLCRCLPAVAGSASTTMTTEVLAKLPRTTRRSSLQRGRQAVFFVFWRVGLRPDRSEGSFAGASLTSRQ